MGVVGARGPHTREDPSPPDDQGGADASRRVVVVDDHELIRSGTKRILDDATGFTVVGEAEDRDGALQVIAEMQPDVVLVDFPHAAVLLPDRIEPTSVVFTHNVEAEIFEEQWDPYAVTPEDALDAARPGLQARAHRSAALTPPVPARRTAP